MTINLSLNSWEPRLDSGGSPTLHGRLRQRLDQGERVHGLLAWKGATAEGGDPR